MEKESWTPADLLKMSGDYWGACALHAGVKLDVFTPLAEKPLTPGELADRIQVDCRALTLLLNALVALALLEKRNDSYSVTPFTAEFLCRTSPGYLGYIILHHHNLMPSWSRLDQAVKRGTPDQKRLLMGNDPVVRENFELGMFNLAMQIGPRVAAGIELSGRRRLLDLGGGPGTYAVHFCQNNPGLTAVVYDLPGTRPFAEQTIARFQMADRISFQGGDFMTDRVDGPFDVAWLSHILHGTSREGCAVILEKAVRALGAGGMILVQDFILDDSMDGPLYPALFALNMLLGTQGGRAYSQGELFAMLTAAGAVDLRRLPLELPNGAGVIAGALQGGK